MNNLNTTNEGRLVRRVVIGLAAGAVALTLASCGGGDDNGIPPPVPTPPTSNTPPASAMQSVTGFIAFLKILVPTRPENTDPLDVTAFVAPTTDTGDPDPSI